MSSFLNPKAVLQSHKVTAKKKSICASKDVRKSDFPSASIWSIYDECWNERKHGGGKWIQPPSAIDLLRTKTVSALKRKVIVSDRTDSLRLNEGQKMQRRARAWLSKEWKALWWTADSQLQTWRRSERDMTGGPQGGLLSQLGWRMQ